MEPPEPVKIEDGVRFYEKLPTWMRRKYLEGVNDECQFCKKQLLYKDMEIHRKIRKSHGGLYTFCKLDHPKQNCMMVHKKCHKLFHQNENGHGSHSY